MEEQMKQHMDQLQKGMESVMETGARVMEPTLRGGEVIAESMGQLASDQLEFGRASMDIYQRQMQSLTDASDIGSFYQTNGAFADYQEASTRFGEAVRNNVDNTRERMLSLGRQAADSVSGAAEKACRTATEQGEAAYQQVTETVNKAAENQA